MRFTQNTKIYLVDACYTYEIFGGTLLVKYFLPAWLQISHLLTRTALQNNLKEVACPSRLCRSSTFKEWITEDFIDTSGETGIAEAGASNSREWRGRCLPSSYSNTCSRY